MAFVVTELRHPTPLIRLGILRSAHLVHANVAGAIMAGGYFAFQFLVTLYLQDSLGWSPLTWRSASCPRACWWSRARPGSTGSWRAYAPRSLIAAGMGSFLVAYVLFLRVDPGLGYAALLLPTMLLLGVGFALTFPSINAQATSGVADHEQGLASGLVNTSVQIGGAVVLAVISAILVNAAASEGPAQDGQLIPGMLTGLKVVAVFTAVGFAASIATLFLRPPVPVETEAEILA